MDSNGKDNYSLVRTIIVSIIILFFTLDLSGFKDFLSNKIDEHVNTVQSVATDTQENTKSTFKIISSSENRDLEDIVREFLSEKNVDLEIEYAGTLEIMEKLNAGEEYDAVWASNSIWLYMLNDNVSISESKSTSINPVVFGIRQSKAEELGFVGKDIYTADIINAIKNGSLKFSMSNPTQTNTGATAYLGFLSNLAGSPEVLKESDLTNTNVRNSLTDLFTGMERSSGDEDFLEELFINSSYDSVVTYESSLININKQLRRQGKETLYIVYPIDGVSISDSPFAYIDNKDDNKKETFLELRNYILSSEGQEKLAKQGRRTWYGGISNIADKDVFNPDWGIDTTKYIVPIKLPSKEVIQKSLALYQAEFRKPVHTVFCLDYSGSMSGEGNEQLVSAMDYILTEEKASKDLLQYTEKDIVTIIPFNGNVLDTITAPNGADTTSILNQIKTITPTGATNIYDSSIEGLEELSKTDSDKYNLSIVIMTDGNSNCGSFSTLKNVYKRIGKDIPIYSIMFGYAVENQLSEIAEYTNAKVFDGRENLLEAFKEVRGYN